MFLATVSFRSLGHDRGRGVAALHVRGGGGDDSGGSAGLQTEGCTKRREGCDQHRDHNLDDLSFVHNSFGLGFKRAVFRNIPFWFVRTEDRR